MSKEHSSKDANLKHHLQAVFFQPQNREIFVVPAYLDETDTEYLHLPTVESGLWDETQFEGPNQIASYCGEEIPKINELLTAAGYSPDTFVDYILIKKNNAVLGALHSTELLPPVKLEELDGTEVDFAITRRYFNLFDRPPETPIYGGWVNVDELLSPKKTSPRINMSASLKYVLETNKEFH